MWQQFYSKLNVLLDLATHPQHHRHVSGILHSVLRYIHVHFLSVKHASNIHVIFIAYLLD